MYWCHGALWRMFSQLVSHKDTPFSELLSIEHSVTVQLNYSGSFTQCFKSP
jgi:hypothetical protein